MPIYLEGQKYKKDPASTQSSNASTPTAGKGPSLTQTAAGPITPTGQTPSLGIGTPTGSSTAPSLMPSTGLSTPTSPVNPPLSPIQAALSAGKNLMDQASVAATGPTRENWSANKDRSSSLDSPFANDRTNVTDPANPQQQADPMLKGQGGTPYEQASQSSWQMKQADKEFQTVNYNFATQVEGLLGFMTDLKNQLAQDDGSQVMIGMWYADMERSLDQAYRQMVSDMNGQMSSQDPAVLAAIQTLKDEVAEQRKSAFEELNARGLGQSGILAEVSMRLSRGELSEIQKMTSARLSELKSQMMVAIQNFAQQRAGLMQSAFQARTQALQGSLDRKAALTGQLLNANTQLVGTVGQWEAARMQRDTTMAGYANARDIARMQIDGEKDITGMRIQGDKDITTLKIGGDKDIANMRIEGDKVITDKQIQGQKDIATMNIEAEAERIEKEFANRVELANIDAATRANIADIQAKNNVAIAEMSNKNEMLALQMKSASDQAANVILPLVASGKLDPQSFLAAIANQPPEVQQMYKPLLEALSAKPAETTTPPVGTPSHPYVQQYETTTQTAELHSEMRSLEAHVKNLETLYQNAPADIREIYAPNLNTALNNLNRVRSQLGLPPYTPGTPSTPTSGR